MVILMVLLIKKAVTKISPTTNPIVIFLTALNTLIKSLTVVQL